MKKIVLLSDDGKMYAIMDGIIFTYNNQPDNTCYRCHIYLSNKCVASNGNNTVCNEISNYIKGDIEDNTLHISSYGSKVRCLSYYENFQPVLPSLFMQSLLKHLILRYEDSKF